MDLATLINQLNAIIKEKYPSKKQCLDALNDFSITNPVGKTPIIFKSSTFYKLLEQPERSKLTKEKFQQISLFIEYETAASKEKDDISASISEIPDFFYHALRNYFGITVDTDYIKKLKGVYKIYCRSNFLNPKIYIGKGVIEQGKANGALKVRILFRAVSKPAEGEIPFRSIEYEYEGYALAKAGRLFLFTKHKTSESMHAIYLDDRSYMEDDTVTIMKGAMTGLLDDNVYANRILFERFDRSTHKGKSIDDIVGVYDPENIHKGVVRYLNRSIDMPSE